VLETDGFSSRAVWPEHLPRARCPALLGGVDPQAAVRVVVEDFEEDETPLQAEIEAKIIARVCKRAAVKAGQALSVEEQARLAARAGSLPLAAHLPARPPDHDPPAVSCSSASLAGAAAGNG
jgi:hypothetical protein